MARFVFRSAYESKLNEQRDAVERLQEEHSRLTAIKNQLLKLNPLADPLAAEKAAERGSMEPNVSILSSSVGANSSKCWGLFSVLEQEERGGKRSLVSTSWMNPVSQAVSCK